MVENLGNAILFWAKIRLATMTLCQRLRTSWCNGVWSIETDDFLGICGKGKFPLLKVVSSIVRNEVTERTPTAIKPTTAASVAFLCMSKGVFRECLEKDCTSFYICSGPSTFEFTCPNGLLFDLTTNTCNWPSQVDCKLKKNKTKYEVRVY